MPRTQTQSAPVLAPAPAPTTTRTASRARVNSNTLPAPAAIAASKRVVTSKPALRTTQSAPVPTSALMAKPVSRPASRIGMPASRAPSVRPPSRASMLMDNAALSKMKRADLQKLCKDEGLKANLKTDALVDALAAHFATRSAPALATSKSTSALPAPTSTTNPVTPPTINSFAPSLPAIPSLSFSGADDGDDMDLATPDNSMTAGGLVLGANPTVGVGMPSFTGMAGSESPSPPKPFGTGSSNAPAKATKTDVAPTTVQAEEERAVAPRQRTVRSGLARLGTGKPTVTGTATVPRVSSGSTSRVVSTQGGGVVGGGVQPKPNTRGRGGISSVAGRMAPPIVRSGSLSSSTSSTTSSSTRGRTSSGIGRGGIPRLGSGTRVGGNKSKSGTMGPPPAPAAAIKRSESAAPARGTQVTAQLESINEDASARSGDLSVANECALVKADKGKGKAVEPVQVSDTAVRAMTVLDTKTKAEMVTHIASLESQLARLPTLESENEALRAHVKLLEARIVVLEKTVEVSSAAAGQGTSSAASASTTSKPSAAPPKTPATSTEPAPTSTSTRTRASQSHLGLGAPSTPHQSASGKGKRRQSWLDGVLDEVREEESVLPTSTAGRAASFSFASEASDMSMDANFKSPAPAFNGGAPFAKLFTTPGAGPSTRVSAAPAFEENIAATLDASVAQGIRMGTGMGDGFEALMGSSTGMNLGMGMGDVDEGDMSFTDMLHSTPAPRRVRGNGKGKGKTPARTAIPTTPKMPAFLSIPPGPTSPGPQTPTDANPFSPGIAIRLAPGHPRSVFASSPVPVFKPVRPRRQTASPRKPLAAELRREAMRREEARNGKLDRLHKRSARHAVGKVVEVKLGPEGQKRGRDEETGGPEEYPSVDVEATSDAPSLRKKRKIDSNLEHSSPQPQNSSASADPIPSAAPSTPTATPSRIARPLDANRTPKWAPITNTFSSLGPLMSAPIYTLAAIERGHIPPPRNYVAPAGTRVPLSFVQYAYAFEDDEVARRTRVAALDQAIERGRRETKRRLDRARREEERDPEGVDPKSVKELDEMYGKLEREEDEREEREKGGVYGEIARRAAERWRAKEQQEVA